MVQQSILGWRQVLAKQEEYHGARETAPLWYSSTCDIVFDSQPPFWRCPTALRFPVAFLFFVDFILVAQECLCLLPLSSSHQRNHNCPCFTKQAEAFLHVLCYYLMVVTGHSGEEVILEACWLAEHSGEDMPWITCWLALVHGSTRVVGLLLHRTMTWGEIQYAGKRCKYNTTPRELARSELARMRVDIQSRSRQGKFLSRSWDRCWAKLLMDGGEEGTTEYTVFERRCHGNCPWGRVPLRDVDNNAGYDELWVDNLDFTWRWRSKQVPPTTANSASLFGPHVSIYSYAQSRVHVFISWLSLIRVVPGGCTSNYLDRASSHQIQ